MITCLVCFKFVISVVPVFPECFQFTVNVGLWFVLIVVKFDIDLNGIFMLHHGVVFLVFN